MTSVRLSAAGRGNSLFNRQKMLNSHRKIVEYLRQIMDDALHLAFEIHVACARVLL